VSGTTVLRGTEVPKGKRASLASTPPPSCVSRGCIVDPASHPCSSSSVRAAPRYGSLSSGQDSLPFPANALDGKFHDAGDGAATSCNMQPAGEPHSPLPSSNSSEYEWPQPAGMHAGETKRLCTICLVGGTRGEWLSVSLHTAFSRGPEDFNMHFLNSSSSPSTLFICRRTMRRGRKSGCCRASTASTCTVLIR
jgi:hypothetical protein